MINERNDLVIKKILEEIELPSSAYETAEKRYSDIGEWLHRPASLCANLKPHVFSQGSFRLGTANKPENDEEYDLDIACNLTYGFSKESKTQKQLKSLIGEELKLYRNARNIKENVHEKRRCWRLEYADEMSFHMDIVPCIPESNALINELKSRMIDSASIDENLAINVANLAVSITDNTDSNYYSITNDWRISNPEGYALWFESRMKKATTFLNDRQIFLDSNIDELPYYQWKTPLQSSIQLLKRHRDIMFKDNQDSKPISIIITTLSARSYNGEADLASTLSNILNSMEQYISNTIPIVPNPVNPAEDFADKWYSPEHEHLKLEENFQRWLIQAKADFTAILSKDNSRTILDAANRGFSVHLDKSKIENLLGLSASIITTKKIEASAPKPWFKK